MFAGLDGTSWLTAALMALTVSIGILGIFQEHHTQEGKLTRVGWVLIGAIALFGLLTFVSAQRDRYAAEQKERSDSVERARQFQSQMGELSRLQRQMQSSLDSQRQIAGTTDENLRMSGRLQNQAQANTSSVLRRVFAEGHRISPERIAVSVKYSCRAPFYHGSYPAIQAVQVAIEGERGTELSLVSRVSTRVSDNIVFHDFLAELGRYETFEAWRNARVRIRITGSPMTLGTSPEDREEIRAEEEELRRRRIEFRPMRCPMSVRLYLNGREMLKTFGYLERTSRFFYLLEFENLRVDPNRLPRF